MKLAAVFVTAALLLNAMAPTLAYAATYLQGAEINANTLIQDAYVVVTYYDSKNKQQWEKGWIDAIDETTFQIRFRALFGKKTIAYNKVLSVIMSEEATSRGKQINEVDRFIQEMEKRMEDSTSVIFSRFLRVPPGRPNLFGDQQDVCFSPVEVARYKRPQCRHIFPFPCFLLLLPMRHL